MRVRAVEEPDADSWAALRARLWPFEDVRQLAAEARAFLKGESVATIAAAFVATGEEAATIGFLDLAIRPFSDGCDSQPVAHVEGWYVEPFARGCGVGRALMQAAENWARERGFTELASDSELHDDDAVAAHLRCGFQETERLVKFRKALS
jgi:aminoglycoside 6'-N-acetyltransferase I